MPHSTKSRLLQRQLERELGIRGDDALDDLIAALERSVQGRGEPALAGLPARLRALLEAVDDACLQADRDLEQRANGVERSSRELLEAKERARVSEQRLLLALRSANATLWDWDLSNDRVMVDDGWQAILGFPAASAPANQRQWEQLVHPDDRERLRAALREQLRPGAADLSTECRMQAAAGRCRWLAVSGRVVSRDTDGRALRLVGTLRDVTEQKAAEVEQLRARNAATAASRDRGDFLAGVSHGIRAPTNGILGGTALLLETELRPEQAQYVDIVRSSADSLLAILNDILDFSNIEAGKMAFENIDFPLRELMADTLRALALRAHQKGLELAYSVPEDLPDLWYGDPGRLRQVLVNLVGNAVKFTESGEIEVTVERAAEPDEAGLLRFTVRDTGLGLTDMQRDHLFEAFAQADQTIARRFGGTGLGLAISRRLVELMGGRIDVASTPNIGSSFSFTAALHPVGAGTPEPAALYRALDGVDVLLADDNAISLGHATRALAHAGVRVRTATGREQALALAGKRPAAAVVDVHLGADDGIALAALLLAEDNPVNVLLARKVLVDAGHKVMVAENGREAVDMWAANAFDVILMDVQMPELDGLAATQEIRLRERALEEAPHVPIVAITANAMEGDRERCLQAGMDDYLSKPFTPSELRAVLERIRIPQRAG